MRADEPCLCGTDFTCLAREHDGALDMAPACECPTDDYCPKCHPRWYAKWKSEQRDVARVVGRDLSDAARAHANSDGWPDQARMHPATAREYEALGRADQ